MCVWVCVCGVCEVYGVYVWYVRVMHVVRVVCVCDVQCVYICVMSGNACGSLFSSPLAASRLPLEPL